MSAPRLNFPYGSGGGGGGGVSGTGTPPALAMWATSSSLTDSPLSFASQTLTLSPSVRFFTFGHHQQWTIPANAYGFAINNQLVLDTGSGYLGVNPPTTPASPLHVEGTVGSSSDMVRLRNQLAGINSHVTIQTHANALGGSSPTGKIQNYTTALTPGYGVYDWVYSLPNPNGVMTEVFRQTAPTTILTVTLTSGGSGYINGSYSQAALTNVSSSGTGATADIVVSTTNVATVVLRSGGSGYQVGDTLTCASIGGGTGFVLTVASVGSRATAAGNVTATRIGAGTTTPRGAFDLAAGAFYATSQDLIIRPTSTSGTFTPIHASVYAGASEQITKNYPVFSFSSAPRIDGSLQPSATICGYGSIPQITASTAAQNVSTYGYQATVYRAQPLDVSNGNTTTVSAAVYGYSAQCGVVAGVGAASTSSVVGFHSIPFVTVVGHTIASFINFQAAAPSFNAASTITDYYGFRQLAHSGAGTITNRWGVSIEDALATNYFAGNVGIGTATPATANSRLTVAGGFIATAAGFGVYQAGDHLTLSGGAGKNVHLKPNDGGVLAVNVGSATCDMTAVAGYVLAVGGPVRATGTTAAAPAFSTPTDTNTGMYFPAADTVRIAAGANIGMEVDPNGTFGINNGFGSIAPTYGCRAWVNFDSTVSGIWAGGASTVTRVAGSTTATITTTNNHGLITGNSVYALTGVAAGYYAINYVGVKTFTITTVATTALSAVPITFAVNNIRASGGVSSVTDISTGIFSVNFSTAMPDVNYSAVGTKQNVSTNSAVSLYDCFTAVGAAPGRTTTQCGWQCIENAAAADSNNVNIAVFR